MKNNIEIHEHAWQKTDWSESRCACGQILVSQAEYDKRENAWIKYQTDIRQTEAYRLFAEGKSLIGEAQMGGSALLRLKEVSARARQLLEDRGYAKVNGRWELQAGLKDVGEVEKPRFLNPLKSTRYTITEEV